LDNLPIFSAFGLVGVAPAGPGHITCGTIKNALNPERKDSVDFLVAIARRPPNQEGSCSYGAFVVDGVAKFDLERECFLESHFLDSMSRVGFGLNWYHA
jgi:hypothetical protein